MSSRESAKLGRQDRSKPWSSTSAVTVTFFSRSVTESVTARPSSGSHRDAIVPPVARTAIRTSHTPLRKRLLNWVMTVHKRSPCTRAAGTQNRGSYAMATRQMTSRYPACVGVLLRPVRTGGRCRGVAPARRRDRLGPCTGNGLPRGSPARCSGRARAGRTPRRHGCCPTVAWICSGRAGRGCWSPARTARRSSASPVRGSAGAVSGYRRAGPGRLGLAATVTRPRVPRRPLGAGRPPARRPTRRVAHRHRPGHGGG